MLTKLSKATKKFFLRAGIICTVLWLVCFFGNMKIPGILKPKDFICFAIFTAVLYALAYLAEIIDLIKSDKGKEAKSKAKKKCIEHKDIVCFILKLASYVFAFFAGINAVIGMVRWFVPGFAPGFGKVSLFAIIIFALFSIGLYVLCNYLSLCEDAEDDEEDAEDEAEEDPEDEGDEPGEDYGEDLDVKPVKPAARVYKPSGKPEFMIVDLDEEDLPDPRFLGDKKGRFVTDDELKDMLLDAYKKGRNSK